MNGNRPKCFFVTGTDTEVGKTYATAQIARQLHAAGVRVGVYKPVASGCVPDARVPDAHGQLVSDDAVRLWEAAGRPESLERVCPQRFAAPLSPPAAAAAENRSVDTAALLEGARWWGERDFQVLLVEGAGGLLSPLSDDWFNFDLAAQLAAPLILVAANRLGVIHHVLQTLLVAGTFRGGLPVAAVLLSQLDATADASVATNAATIRRSLERLLPPAGPLSSAPPIAALDHGGQLPEPLLRHLLDFSPVLCPSTST